MIILPSYDSSYGMTLQEMIDDVADNIRNSKISTRITSWINQEIMNLASVFVFPHLHSTSAIYTEVGVRNYVLEEDFHYLKIINNPTLMLPLNPIGEAKLANEDPLYKTTQGPVTDYTLNFRSIDLYKVPSEVVPLEYSYQRRPLKLINSSDVSDLPPEWHPLFVLGATKRGIRREERGTDEFQSVVAEYDSMKRELSATLKRRLDVVTVLENPEQRNSKPWPRLDPSHYPAFRR